MSKLPAAAFLFIVFNYANSVSAQTQDGGNVEVHLPGNIGTSYADLAAQDLVLPLLGADPTSGRLGLGPCVSLPNGSRPGWRDLVRDDLPGATFRSNFTVASSAEDVSNFRASALSASGSYSAFSGSAIAQMSERRIFSRYTNVFYGMSYLLSEQRNVEGNLELTQAAQSFFETTGSQAGTGRRRLIDPVGFRRLCGTHFIIGSKWGVSIELSRRFESSSDEEQRQMRGQISLAYQGVGANGQVSAEFQEAFTRVSRAEQSNGHILAFSSNPPTTTPINLADFFNLFKTFVNQESASGNHSIQSVTSRPYRLVFPEYDFTSLETNTIVQSAVESYLQQLMNLISSYDYIKRRMEANDPFREFFPNNISPAGLEAMIARLNIELSDILARVRACSSVSSPVSAGTGSPTGMSAACRELENLTKNFRHVSAPARTIVQHVNIRDGAPQTIWSPTQIQVQAVDREVPFVGIFHQGFWCASGPCHSNGFDRTNNINCFVITNAAMNQTWRVHTDREFLVPSNFEVRWEPRRVYGNPWNDHSYRVGVFRPLDPTRFLRFSAPTDISGVPEGFNRCLP